MPSSPTAASIALLWICVSGAIVVFGAMLCSIVAFGRAPTQTAKPRCMSAELLWAVVPIVIVIAMAAPSVAPLLSPGTDSVNRTAQQPSQPAAPVHASQKTFNEGAVPL